MMQGIPRVPPVLANVGQACYNCFKDRSNTTNLQRCSGCSRVYYCGSECQKANWSRHKGTCKAFKSVETNKGPDMLAPFMFLDEDEDTLVVTNIPQLHASIEMVSAVLTSGMESELKRPLRVDEQNLIGWEPRCLACGRSDAIFRIEASLRNRTALSTGLKPCPDCNLSFFCCTEHWDAMKDRHQNEPCQDGRDNLSQCAMNKFCVEDVRFSEFMAGANRGEFQWAPERTLPTFKRLGTAEWNEEFMSDVTRDFGRIPSMIPLLDCVLRGASESLSMPMTILYALENLHGDESWTKKDTLHVHLLGAADKEILAGQIFEEILHRLPLIKALRLTYCGPELQDSFGNSSREMSMDTCPDCLLKGRKRIHEYQPKTYHDYIADEGAAYAKPELAIAFNSGMSQEETFSWKQTVDALVKHGIPTLFTAFNQEEADAEANMLRAAGANLDAHPELGPVRNPWGSLISRSEPNKVFGFYANNGWLAGGFV